jgi:hypothetical protein
VFGFADRDLIQKHGLIRDRPDGFGLVNGGHGRQVGAERDGHAGHARLRPELLVQHVARFGQRLVVA